MTPGPDLMYLTGYAPVAITERITMLVIPVTGDPTMIVPKLERPDAENAVGAAGLQLVDWADGSDPYEATGRLLAGTGRYAISDSAWAMHVLGLQVELAQLLVRVTDQRPADVARHQGCRGGRAAGGGRGSGRPGIRADSPGAVRRPPGDRGRRGSGRPAAPVRTFTAGLHGGGVGPQRGEPASRDRRTGHRGRRHGRARLRRAEVRVRVGHDDEPCRAWGEAIRRGQEAGS